jgi:hypothetical protein
MTAIRFIFAASVVALSACASTPKKDEAAPEASPTTGQRLDATRKGLGSAMVAPLKDVGLVRPEAPKMLSDIKYPYTLGALANGCAQVTYEIGALDALLGPESYDPKARKTMHDSGLDYAEGATIDAATSATTDFIPFRSWVRKASGAERAERDQARAIEMGQTRRSFLRGYGAAMGCASVLPPGPKGENTDQSAVRVVGAGAPP